MSRAQRSIVRLLSAIYVLAWLALCDAQQSELVDEDLDDGVFGRWRVWGSA